MTCSAGRARRSDSAGSHRCRRADGCKLDAPCRHGARAADPSVDLHQTSCGSHRQQCEPLEVHHADDRSPLRSTPPITRTMNAPTTTIKIEPLKVACSSCNLRELCLPVGGLSPTDLEQLDTLVATRRSAGRRDTP